MTELARLGLYVDSSGVVRATKELQKLEREGGKAEKQSEKLKRSFGGLKTAALAVSSAFAAIGLVRLVGNVADAGLALDAMNSSLRVATGSSEAAAREMEFLRQTSEQLGLDIRSSGDAFASLAAAARGTALEGQGARDIFVAVSEAMTALGRNSEATEGALRAIEQMISKGNVSAEELRGQLGERLPGAFQLAARSIGVTTQELDGMLRNGEVLAADLLPKLAGELRNTFSAEAERRANGLQAEINRFKNAVFDLQTSGNLDSMANAIRDITTLIKNPQFQQGFSAFVGGMITLAEKGANAAAFVGNLFTDSLEEQAEEAQKIVEDLERQLRNTKNPIAQLRIKEELAAAREEAEKLQVAIWEAGTQPSTPDLPSSPAKITPVIDSKAAEKARKEAERLAESYRNLTQSLSAQYTMLGMTEREAFIYEAQLRLSAGATNEMRQNVEYLAGRLYDEQAALEAAAEAELERNAILEQGKALTEAMLTPMEAYLAQLQRIDDLADQAAITEETAARARQKAFEDMKDAAKKNTDEMTVFMEEFAKNTQNLLADNLFDFMQGEFEFTADGFKRMLDRMVAEAIAADLASKLFGSMSGVEGSSGSGLVGSLFSSIGSFFGGSFDGGGYTGNGARAGGLDGKGGQLAMIHPRETIVDHTKGQSVGNTITISPTYHITSNNAQAVRQTIDQSHQQLARQLQHAQRNM